MKSTMALIAFLVSTGGALIAVERWIENEYAKDRVVRQSILTVQQDYLNLDIDQAAAWAAHYRRKNDDEGLTKAETQRLDHLERQLERAYRRAEMLEQAQVTMGAD